MSVCISYSGSISRIRKSKVTPAKPPSAISENKQTGWCLSLSQWNQFLLKCRFDWLVLKIALEAWDGQISDNWGRYRDANSRYLLDAANTNFICYCYCSSRYGWYIWEQGDGCSVCMGTVALLLWAWCQCMRVYNCCVYYVFIYLGFF